MNKQEQKRDKVEGNRYKYSSEKLEYESLEFIVTRPVFIVVDIFSSIPNFWFVLLIKHVEQDIFLVTLD